MSFGLDNLPYASVVAGDGRRRAVVRLGDAVLDLARVDDELFATGTLDALLAAGPQRWSDVRGAVAAALTRDAHPLVPLAEVEPVLGFTVADFVDFYASLEHASNAGRIFRPDSPALPASWRHQPIGYHGRAGSVVASGTPIRRPRGQFRDGGEVVFAPTRKLDFEAEVAFVVGAASRTGEPVDVADADQHVFGLCLLNDWSARDVQGFETVPLGPFLGKSFATSISPWITPLEALRSAALTPVRQDPPPLPHLRAETGHALALHLSVALNGEVVSRPDLAGMYWTYAQLLAHLTSNGSSVRPGDVFASGTVSGSTRDTRGSLLELAWNGTEPLVLADGSTRRWLLDGDEVEIRAAAGDLSIAGVLGIVTATDDVS